MKEKVLITGASGALAKRVKTKLEQEGYEVVALTTSRTLANEKTTFLWDISRNYIDDKAFLDCDHIVHLSGFSIVKPWSKKNKQLMYDSRVKAADLLFKYCKSLKLKIKTFVTASALGYYGMDAVGLQTEDNPAGNDWLAKMCVDWEQSASAFENLGVRVVKMRISLLLAKDAGFLQPTMLSMRFGVGVVFGSGKQAIEWMHIDDAANFVTFALGDKSVSGPYNMANNQRLNQAEFMRVIKSKVAPYALMFHLPSFMLKLIFGSRSIILEGGVALSNEKLRNTTFESKYPSLESAIDKILSNE